MKFDSTVNLGHILILLGVAGSGIAAYMGARVTLNEHEMRLNTIELNLKSQYGQLQNMENSSWAIQRDVAVIKDRLDRK